MAASSCLPCISVHVPPPTSSTLPSPAPYGLICCLFAIALGSLSAVYYCCAIPAFPAPACPTSMPSGGGSPALLQRALPSLLCLLDLSALPAARALPPPVSPGQAGVAGANARRAGDMQRRATWLAAVLCNYTCRMAAGRQRRQDNATHHLDAASRCVLAWIGCLHCTLARA